MSAQGSNRLSIMPVRPIYSTDIEAGEGSISPQAPVCTGAHGEVHKKDTRHKMMHEVSSTVWIFGWRSGI